MALDDVTEGFLQKAKAVRLGDDERAAVRAQLQQFMREQSVESLTAKDHKEVRQNLVDFMRGEVVEPKDVEAEHTSVIAHLWTILSRTMIAACAFVLVGAGASYAAEGSVPGDALYPLKVKIFEPIQSSLSFSDESRAKWETTRAQRRIKEAEALAAKNSLTEEAWHELNTDFFLHVIEAEKRIETISKQGQTNAASSLSADIDTYIESNTAVAKAFKNAVDKVEKVKDVADEVGKEFPVTAKKEQSSAASTKERSSASTRSVKPASVADTVDEVIDDVLEVPSKIPVVFPSSKKNEQHSKQNSEDAQSSLNISSSPAHSSAISSQASSAVSSAMRDGIIDEVLDTTDSLLPNLLD